MELRRLILGSNETVEGLEFFSPTWNESHEERTLPIQSSMPFRGRLALPAPVFALALALALAWTPVLPGQATALQNAAATVRLYWQDPATGKVLPGRDDTASTVQILVTARGLSNFRGCDVQLMVDGFDGGGVPSLWQFQPEGCAAGRASFHPGGTGKGPFPSVIKADPAMTTVVVSQDRAAHGGEGCLVPPNRLLLWFSAAGGSGVGRDSSSEYALWAITLSLPSGADTSRACLEAGAGGGATAQTGVCITPWFHIPCGQPGSDKGAAVDLLDGLLEEDFVPFEKGFDRLTWWGGAGMSASACPVAARKPVWGRVKTTQK